MTMPSPASSHCAPGPLPTKEPMSPGDVPHSRLKIFDSDEDQSEAGQNRAKRSHPTFGDQPKEGADAKDRHGRDGDLHAKSEKRDHPRRRSRARVAPIRTPTACEKVTNPALTKPMTVRTVALYDWINAVRRLDERNRAKAASYTARSPNLPLGSFRPSVMELLAGKSL